MGGFAFLVAFRRGRRTESFTRLTAFAQALFRIRAAAAGALALAGVAYFVPWLAIRPRAIVASAACLVLVSAAWSYLTRSLFGARRLHRVLIVGGGDHVRRFVNDLAGDPHPEYEIAGVLCAERVATIDGVPRIGGIDDLEPAIVEHRIDTVAIAVEHGRLELFARLSELDDADVCVQELPAFSEHVLGKVPVEGVNAAWFMHMVHPSYRPYSQAAKRVADVVLALGIGVVVLPVVPLVALAVRVTSRGPAFYSQTRVGQGGREFRIHKFRTMVQDAERDGARWAECGDARITRLGRPLRASRIDEIPQLWNVLRGQMSFVGPRPERPEFVGELEQAIPYYQRRHLVKPGITGWAQVRRGYADSVDGSADKLGYELYYLKQRSLLFDVVIFLETIRVVLLRFGSR